MIQSLEDEMIQEQHRIIRICDNHERFIGNNLEDLRDFFIDVIKNGWEFEAEARKSFFIDSEKITQEQLKEVWDLAKSSLNMLT